MRWCVSGTREVSLLLAVRRRMRLPLSFALFFALAVAGCDTLRWGGNEAAVLPAPQAPRVMGAPGQGDGDHRRLVSAFGGEYSAPAMERLLDQIAARLVAASGEPSQRYQVTILNSPLVNAFALPDGRLYVTRGLLALANDESEIAAVMAHEIAHVIAKHGAQRAELERRATVASRVATEVLQSRAAGEAVAAQGMITLAGFSRAQELQADEIGVAMIAKAGFDPEGAVRFLAALGRQSAMRSSLFNLGETQDKMSFLATHPSTPERTARAQAAAKALAAGKTVPNDRNAYLQALDGMVYGDDPAEGLVRGRKFLHPRLGFEFTVPDGFALENTASAVIGINSDQGQAFRFDAIAVASGLPLSAAIATGWIENTKLGNINPISPGGLEGATAVAHGAEWSFRFAAIRYGGNVYRFMFAARDFTQAADRSFLASIESFRPLGADDAGRSRPLRITLVTATANDTVESLAARMATPDHALARFLLLNGLTKPALKVGETYKIVSE